MHKLKRAVVAQLVAAGMLLALVERYLTVGSGTNVFEAGAWAKLTASAVVAPQACSLMGIFVSQASATPTITVRDSATAGGGAILVNTFTPVAGTFYPMPFVCMAGLNVVISGTVDCTVAYASGQ